VRKRENRGFCAAIRQFAGWAQRCTSDQRKETQMSYLINRLIAWIDRSHERELEEYLARSGNVAELERRLRDWETRGVK
jgi:hypothetical protein